MQMGKTGRALKQELESIYCAVTDGTSESL